ncbi:MAG: DUF2309 domain-containing protein [Rhodobacterales bacterium]|nr:DUF2309 domain-containing protein [Rhodobacterales bacterium]
MTSPDIGDTNMFLRQSTPAPARSKTLLKAAETAARRVPPAFPLSATVAVNPFLGQTGEDLATASARLARVAGLRITQPRSTHAAVIKAGRITDDDLAAALIACPSGLKPTDLGTLKARLAMEPPTAKALPTVAELAARSTGTDWPAVVTRCLGLWAAGQFDRGQALWSPAPGRSTFAAWRAWAVHDLTPEIAGLRGFCAHVAEAPDTAERAILAACETLGVTDEAAETLFHRLFIDLGGWAQHARWLLWEAELAGDSDQTLTDLLAIRLVWEAAIFDCHPALAADWRATLAAHAAPVAATTHTVLDAILQEAAERAHQRQIAALLTGPRPATGRPALQAAFCIDVRSEVFRRALEALDPGIATIGFAGFFGLTLAHRGPGTDLVAAHLPVLLNAGFHSHSHAAPALEESSRIAARTARAWGRFRQAAVSSFAFVEAAGPTYAVKLVTASLGLSSGAKTPDPAPEFDTPLTAEAKATTGAAVLKAMSMGSGHARLVLLLGHGAQVTNNPHESAYHCGACGGQTGEVSARLLARLLNDPETRSGLAGHGVTVPADTIFIAGLHDTTTDEVTLYEDDPSAGHTADLSAARDWLARAAKGARTERAARLPGATASTITERALDWAEVRPEWGLAGCAAFIAAPRTVTTGADLKGRAFLHSYDWQADAGFGTLELILTAPVVVASWISLQYYGSSVAPDCFGGGNKLIHNVVGGIGVVQGNGGMLRPGLPWQTVHDGEALVHEPLRLSVLVEAPRAEILNVLARHDGVRALFDNGWMHLFVLEEGRIAARYRPGLAWEEASDLRQAA